jgi:hypothetical protein
VDPKFLSNPRLGDFAHLLRVDANIRKKITINIDRGIIEVDTHEEGKLAPSLVEIMVETRRQFAVAESEKIAAALPKSMTGTTLAKAMVDYLGKRQSVLKDTTWRKQRNVIEAFIQS